MKPLIGITPQHDAESNHTWMREQYPRAIALAGGIPVVLEQETDAETLDALCAHLDGVLFSGGPDVHPRYYGAEVEPECGFINDARDAFEMALYSVAERHGLPMLGICRGIQFMNVAAGGTLYQHVPGHSDVRHPVTVLEGSLLHGYIGKTAFTTNSYHHQLVRDVAPGCIACAWSEDGQRIEGIERPGGIFWLGIQWHPEYPAMEREPEASAIFSAFVRAAQEHRDCK